MRLGFSSEPITLMVDGVVLSAVSDGSRGPFFFVVFIQKFIAHDNVYLEFLRVFML